MRKYRLRTDLDRAAVGDYALPLGMLPVSLPAPEQGYTLTYELGDDADASHYVFHVVVSHDRLKRVAQDALDLMPEEVTPVLEVSSRDAYRSVDVFVAREGMPLERFLSVWREYEPILLEDASVGFGATAEEPMMEVFLDAWKGLSIHAPLAMRGRIERVLARHGLKEVLQTWPDSLERTEEPCTTQREVLAVEDDEDPDLDEILLQLREALDLELDVDPEENTDEQGRELGYVLWQAIALVESRRCPGHGAYVFCWLTARNLSEVETLLMGRIETMSEWEFAGFYSVDRCTFDDRPEELNSLAPKRSKGEIHSINIDTW